VHPDGGARAGTCQDRNPSQSGSASRGGWLQGMRKLLHPIGCAPLAHG
jgi:hypothetical protein